MKKIEDIPKKQVFKVPDGYFEELPTVIQSRIADRSTKSPVSVVFKYTVRFALPLAALVIAGILWFRPEPTFENELDSIDVNQIAFYLDSNELTTEDDHDASELTTAEIVELEDAIFSELGSIDSEEDILNDIDLENL